MRSSNTAEIKIKVKCNQTGKVFISPLYRLEDESCNPILKDDLTQGASVYWTDANEGYPVTVLKIIGTGMYV